MDDSEATTDNKNPSEPSEPAPPPPSAEDVKPEDERDEPQEEPRDQSPSPLPLITNNEPKKPAWEDADKREMSGEISGHNSGSASPSPPPAEFLDQDRDKDKDKKKKKKKRKREQREAYDPWLDVRDVGNDGRRRNSNNGYGDGGGSGGWYDDGYGGYSYPRHSPPPRDDYDGGGGFDLCLDYIRFGKCSNYNCDFVHKKIKNFDPNSQCVHWFGRGSCPNGDNCRWRHGDSSPAEKRKLTMEQEAYAIARKRTIGERPCIFYWKNRYCVNGKNCSYAHTVVHCPNWQLSESREKKGRCRFGDMCKLGFHGPNFPGSFSASSGARRLMMATRRPESALSDMDY